MKTPLTLWRKALPVYSHPVTAMEAMLDRFLEDPRRDFETPALTSEIWENGQLSPSVDIINAKDLFKVEAEVPGMGPEDLKISITDHTLIIQGEKTTSRKDKDKNYTRREIAYGTYRREIALPESVDTEQVKASFKKGMLWVEMPKKAGVAGGYQEIAVESAD